MNKLFTIKCVSQLAAGLLALTLTTSGYAKVEPCCPGKCCPMMSTGLTTISQRLDFLKVQPIKAPTSLFIEHHSV